MMRILVVLIGVALAASASVTAQTPRPDPFAPVAFMLGKWTGTIEGEPGTGTVTREYVRVLNDRFIRITNRSEYPPQAKNPKGEIHHDEGFFSMDRARKRLVLRQFHVEGFVNQYVQEADGTLVFVSEAIENIPAGFKARETYVRADADHFEEIFEMAEPGKPFAVYSRTKFTRVKSASQQDALALLREALGGETALSAIRTIRARGTIERRPYKDNIEIAVALPDQFLRTVRYFRRAGQPGPGVFF